MAHEGGDRPLDTKTSTTVDTIAKTRKSKTPTAKFVLYVIQLLVILPVWLLVTAGLAKGGADLDRPDIAIIGWIGVIFGLAGVAAVPYRIIQRKRNPAASDKWFSAVQRDGASNIVNTDARSLGAVRRDPRTFIWPLITAPLAPFFGFFMMIVIGMLTYYLPRDYAFLLAALLGCFFAVCVYFLGFILSGELLQRKITGVKRSLARELITDYWKALPLLILLTFMLIIFVFLYDRKNHDGLQRFALTGSLWNLSLTGMLIVLKYYVYLNLAIIVFEDASHKVSYRESARLLSQQKKPLFYIFLGAGFTIGLIGLAIVGLHAFGLIGPQATATTLVIAGLLGFYLQTVSEQIQILVHYVKLRHPEAGYTVD